MTPASINRTETNENVTTLSQILSKEEEKRERWLNREGILASSSSNVKRSMSQIFGCL
jgi:hypothetical protein